MVPWKEQLQDTPDDFLAGLSMINVAKEEYRRAIIEELKAKEAEKSAEKEAATKRPFMETGKRIGQLVDEKNKAYGDSFGKSKGIINILYPNGISLNQYENMLPMIRIIDKLFRIATDNDPFGEDAWEDIAGYAILQANKVDKGNP